MNRILQLEEQDSNSIDFMTPGIEITIRLPFYVVKETNY